MGNLYDISYKVANGEWLRVYLYDISYKCRALTRIHLRDIKFAYGNKLSSELSEGWEGEEG